MTDQNPHNIDITDRLTAWADERRPWDKDEETKATAWLREAAEKIHELRAQIRR